MSGCSCCISHSAIRSISVICSEILIAQEGKNPRKLTPRECARLQGFPDTFKIPVSDTQAYMQFGNSVVVPLMSNVAQLIVKKLHELEAVDNCKIAL